MAAQRRYSWPPVNPVKNYNEYEKTHKMDQQHHLGIYEFHRGTATVYPLVFQAVTNCPGERWLLSGKDNNTLILQPEQAEVEQERKERVVVTAVASGSGGFDGFTNCYNKSEELYVCSGGAATTTSESNDAHDHRPSRRNPPSSLRPAHKHFYTEAQFKKVITLWHNYYPEGQWGWIIVFIAALINCILHGFQLLITLTVSPRNNKGIIVPDQARHFIVSLESRSKEFHYYFFRHFTQYKIMIIFA